MVISFKDSLSFLHTDLCVLGGAAYPTAQSLCAKLSEHESNTDDVCLGRVFQFPEGIVQIHKTQKFANNYTTAVKQVDLSKGYSSSEKSIFNTRLDRSWGRKYGDLW